MEKDTIDVQLSVEIKNDAVFAHLMFRNKSEKSVYLNKQVTYYDGLVKNNYFEIEDDNGSSIDYLGVMSNCTKKPDEFMLVAPGETLQSTISLQMFYELTKGRSYRVQYYAYNPSYKENQPQLMRMQSNKVEISY